MSTGRNRSEFSLLVVPERQQQHGERFVRAAGKHLFFVVCLLVVHALTFALSQVTQIDVEFGGDPALRNIEVRNVTLPDGTETELFILQGDPVTLRIDEDVLVANYIEWDQESGLLRIVGPGTFTTPEQTIEGEDFVVELDDEVLRGQIVLIFTEAIDVRGVQATRVPGLIDVTGGAFSPCSRCEQEVHDYGFRAGRLQLYPGDRLIAYDVTVLIRDVPVFFLPVMIVPLGPPERQPQLSIRRGTALTRAEVALVWPYTAGPNAYGFTTLQYYADIVPGEGGLLGDTLLGGRVRTSYLGGGIYHRFFTDTADGLIDFGFVPAFIDPRLPEGRTRHQFAVRFRYETHPDLPPPSLGLVIERDDARRQRLIEYRLTARNIVRGIEGRFLTQGFFDLEPTDEPTSPSYASRTVPERTHAQVTFTPADNPTYTVGPFRISGLLLDLGVFEDQPNPTNRRVARLDDISAARLLASHAIRLDPVSPWGGLILSGETRFVGRYYSTGERLIDWATRMDLRQEFGDVGNLSVTFLRSVNEGETPFRFDQLPLRARSEIRASLSLRPLPFFAIEVNETYVLRDNRSPRDLGPGPLITTVGLFGNLQWLDITIRNSYNLKEADPGLLSFEATLRTPPDPEISGLINVVHVQDLQHAPDRLAGRPVDESVTRIRAEATFRPSVRFDMRAGYIYDPPEVTGVDPVLAFWEPFELGVTFGTLELTDDLPGVRFSYQRDLNRNAMRGVGVEASTRLGPLDVSLEQRYNFINKTLGTSRYTVTWRGAVALEATGFAIIPPSLVGLELSPTRRETHRIELRDATNFSSVPLWLLAYQREFDGALNGGLGGWSNTRLLARANAENFRLDGIDFSVRFSADLRLPDDLVQRTFLESASLVLSAEFYERVGVQGVLGYTTVFRNDELQVQRLRIQDFAITVRVLDELYVSTIFNDVWDLTGRSTLESPFNFQPEFRLTWNRCCWALYSSWDTRTGAVSITLAAPGGDQGLTQEFDSGLRLPGRPVVP